MSHGFSKSVVLVCMVLLVPAVPCLATPIITGSSDAATLANLLVLGTNVTLVPGSASFYGKGGAEQSGTFTGGLGDVGFDSGIVLTSGSAINIQNNVQNFYPGGAEILGSASPAFDTWSTIWDSATSPTGDADLSSLVGGASIFDPNVLEFAFTLGEDASAWDLSFNFVFASEEYINFVNSNFNDVVGLFIDGANIGTLSDGSVVSVNAINPLVNPSLYRNNVPGYYTQAEYLADPDQLNPTIPSLGYAIEPDGLTAVLTAQAPLLSPGQHTAKLVIGDVANPELDSAVFIQAGSFSATPAIPEPGTLLLVGSGMALAGLLRLRRSS